MEQEGGKTGRFGDCSSAVIGACIEVHRQLGPGLLESTYEHCVACELLLLDLRFERQKALPLKYKGTKLDCGYRLDLVVEGELILEIKCVDQLLPIHEAQLLTYLRLTGLRTGLLVNFRVSVLRNGLRRLTLSNIFPSSRLPVHPSDEELTARTSRAEP
jgi:GxxExxY protein